MNRLLRIIDRCPFWLGFFAGALVAGAVGAAWGWNG